jgi:hypothetical protein
VHREKRLIKQLHAAGLITMILAVAACSGSGAVVDTNTPGAAPASVPGATPPSTGVSVTPLSLAGSPPTSVTAGATYSFRPIVSSGAAPVTFAIKSKPAWANFNADTGALSGTPADGNVGTTPNIVITASNGSSSASLQPFAITVDAPPSPPAGTGIATLTWTAPTTNTDGTALTDLAGYHIYYGTSAEALTQEVDVPGAVTTTYEISGLNSGTYYFSVTAYSSIGIESAESNVGSKTI